MKDFTSSKWFVILVSFGIALLLFFNANSDNNFFNSSSNSNTQPTFSVVAEEVPVSVKYDADAFFISAYKESMSVVLKSSNRILLDTEMNSETRNFMLQADLTGYKAGKHKVDIKALNLPAGVEVTLESPQITFDLEERITQTFNVHPKLNDNLLKNGYTLEDIGLTPESVAVTTGKKTMNKIADVIVSVDQDKEIVSDFEKEYDVYAIDNEGNILTTIIDPSKIKVNIDVTAPSKSVPVTIKQSGKIPDGVKSYSFTTPVQNVEIIGSRDVIDSINQVEVFVDTSTIKETKTGDYKIETINNVTMNPETVSVTITPKLVDKK
ncbi:CdaR family protein [Vagococcus xieshaowenii]|uniref:YbbR domain-containing protein n=1 Tax=Vagococcus xieshaowenii TaxID=2562451 RepID=A0AAJ5JL24_9ENTE|nr:CdaR family protein [Vagococcus xieshaowenii]QCA29055.1 hypothetical protein E4Z98_06905 [Vagococcus xieshaowenii]TFZ40969.1 hypothetical protein E4031_06190 [Vagococcus xieshaowenii]